ncbi:MAG: DUF1512 domain-containing protein [Candidatus Methanomethylicia archaeon]|nr:DUF1512 domain-containing protein [Candidatus Methanomethylicia archaeon]MCX8169111.1 DUF1512 domain-containing protein [Candidatus Methanomethylicia archaeon]
MSPRIFYSPLISFQIIPSESINSYLLQLIYFLIIIFTLAFLNQKLQTYMWLRGAEASLKRLQILANKSKEITIKKIKELGKLELDPSSSIENFLDFFVIEPTSLDPYGIVNKLKHILSTRDERIESFIKQVAPTIPQTYIPNVEGLLETTIGLNELYKIIRHYFILGKKTRNMFLLMQLQMNLPIIMRYAEAYFKATYAFSRGTPIGDGIGALIASKLMYGKEVKLLTRKTVFSEFEYNGRKLIVIKAEGPGAEVGKIDDAVERIMNIHGDKISRIIMIDAALKLEGEKTGHIAEGVGAAIGGTGIEKFKLEEIATKYNIPLDALIIKMSLEEAITTIRKDIINAADIVIKKVFEIVDTRSSVGDAIIVVGVGNSMGII